VCCCCLKPTTAGGSLDKRTHTRRVVFEQLVIYTEQLTSQALAFIAVGAETEPDGGGGDAAAGGEPRGKGRGRKGAAATTAAAAARLEECDSAEVRVCLLELGWVGGWVLNRVRDECAQELSSTVHSNPSAAPPWQPTHTWNLPLLRTTGGGRNCPLPARGAGVCGAVGALQGAPEPGGAAVAGAGALSVFKCDGQGFWLQKASLCYDDACAHAPPKCATKMSANPH